MSFSTITSSAFNLKPFNSGSYELEVTFLDENSNPVSKRQHVFTQQVSPSCERITDVYSQNGTCSEIPSHLFKRSKGCLFGKSDERAIGLAAKKWTAEKPQRPSVLVLDLKDSEKSYKNRATIAQGEREFSDFLQSDGTDPSILPRAGRIHSLYQKSLPVDFILREGSLKSDLLRTQFSDPEAEYLLTHGKDLCQYAEFYMNGFKLGQSTKGIFAEDYFLPCAAKDQAFKPGLESSVWYPEDYSELYSVDSPFFQGMKPVFSVTGSNDEATGISCVTVGRKS